MEVAILTTGTELTRGELINSNAAWLSERLTSLGLEVVEHAVVPDDAARIMSTLARFGREVKLVVCTGGLGPTSDDLTAQSVATLLGVPLVRHAPTLARIHERYRRFQRSVQSSRDLANAALESLEVPALEVPALIEKQADVPDGASVLDNDEGTAPGFAIAIGSAVAYFFPGVPREMKHLFERYTAPDVAARVVRTSVQRHVRVFGLGESEVAQRVADLDEGGAQHHPAVTIGYRAHFPEVEIKVLARVGEGGEGGEGGDEREASALADKVTEDVRGRLSPYAYGGKDDTFPAFVGAQLRAQGLRLALAESCTGGLVAKLLTDSAGSSDYFLSSIVTYSNDAKQALLGVDAALLERHGAVSAEVATAMAEGALARSTRIHASTTGAMGASKTGSTIASPTAPASPQATGLAVHADLAVAITGIAGPGGGSADKPVGTVWLALARRGQPTVARRRQWSGARDRVRTAAAYYALQMIVESLANRLGPPSAS